MTKSEATAEVFMTALRALPKPERDAVLVRIARDRVLGRDLIDLVLIEDRREEPSRPLDEYLAEKASR